jgi:hypothetical protein
MLSALETDLAGRVPQDLLGEADRVTISYCMLAQLLLERIACTNTALAADVLEAATEFAQCEQRMVALRQSSPNMSALVDRLLEHMEEREQEQ